MEIIPQEALLTFKEVSKTDCDPRLQPFITVYRKRLSKRTSVEETRRRKAGVSVTSIDDFFTIYEVTNKEAYENYLGTSFPNATIYIFKMYDKYAKDDRIPWRLSQYPDHNPQGSGYVDHLVTASLVTHEHTEGIFNCSCLIAHNEIVGSIELPYYRFAQNGFVFGQKITAKRNTDGTITCTTMGGEEIRDIIYEFKEITLEFPKYYHFKETKSEVLSILYRAQDKHNHDPRRHKHKTTLRYGVIILNDK